MLNPLHFKVYIRHCNVKVFELLVGSNGVREWWVIRSCILCPQPMQFLQKGALCKLPLQSKKLWPWISHKIYPNKSCIPSLCIETSCLWEDWVEKNLANRFFSNSRKISCLRLYKVFISLALSSISFIHPTNMYWALPMNQALFQALEITLWTKHRKVPAPWSFHSSWGRRTSA